MQHGSCRAIVIAHVADKGEKFPFALALGHYPCWSVKPAADPVPFIRYSSPQTPGTGAQLALSLEASRTWFPTLAGKNFLNPRPRLRSIMRLHRRMSIIVATAQSRFGDASPDTASSTIFNGHDSVPQQAEARVPHSATTPGNINHAGIVNSVINGLVHIRCGQDQSALSLTGVFPVCMEQLRF